MHSDNVEVDVLGANLYGRYINGASIPASRQIPTEVTLKPQMVTTVESILVETGVHSSNKYVELGRNTSWPNQSHREFVASESDLYRPTLTADNVYEAVKYILDQEQLVT